jgi:uncharacterized protein
VRWVVGFLGLFVGCLGSRSDPARLYTLPYQPPAAVAEHIQGDPKVYVAPIQIAEHLVGSAMVFRVSSEEVRALDGHRWAEPLDIAARRFIRDVLGRRLGPDAVSTSSGDGRRAGAHLVVEILTLEPDASGTVTLDARWRLVASPGEIHGGHFVETKASTGTTQNIVQAMGFLLEAFCAQISFDGR